MIRPICSPLVRPIATALSSAMYGFSPRSLFAANEQGIWLDPSDFSTLFQDAAGTTPVTALGQPVGLALDKHLGLALGSEKIANGAIAITGSATAATYNSTTGVGSVTRVDASNQSYVTFTALATNNHLITITNTGATELFIRAGTGINAVAYGVAAGATLTARLFTTSGAFAVTGNTGTVTFVVNSVREIAGNHAYQTTAASRQTAQSNYLSLDKTDDHLLVAAGGAGTTGFLLVAGIMVPAAGSARTLWSDRGTNTGYKVGIDASNQIFLSAGNGAAFVTATGPALVAGTKYVITAWHDGANLNISVNNGAPTQAAFVTATAGTATITIGKANASATEYWGDRIYGMVYRKNDTSAASQRSSLYSYMVGKMGGL